MVATADDRPAGTELEPELEPEPEPAAVLSSQVITDIEQACDRIVVLGGGRKILDESIGEAIASRGATILLLGLGMLLVN